MAIPLVTADGNTITTADGNIFGIASGFFGFDFPLTYIISPNTRTVILDQ